MTTNITVSCSMKPPIKLYFPELLRTFVINLIIIIINGRTKKLSRYLLTNPVNFNIIIRIKNVEQIHLFFKL